MASVQLPLLGFTAAYSGFVLSSARILVLGPSFLFLVYITVNEIVRLRSRVPRLAGPWGYPLVGSLPSIEGKANSEEYRKWAARYGDVFQVQLGNTTAVVVNSAAAARALFIAQREATNGRPIFYVLHKKVQRGGPVTSIGTSPWDESCRRRRKVAATALNKTSVQSYLPILNLESRAFLRDILATCQNGTVAVNILDPARKFSLNLSLTLSYGTRFEDVKDLHDDLLLSEIIYIEEQIAAFRDVSSNLSNYIPVLRPLHAVAAFLGFRSGTHIADVGNRRQAYHAALQENLRREIARGADRPCIQGNVLKDPESKGLSEGELLSVSLSMMAGADTTKRSIMWAMLLLAHRQDVQEKAYRAIAESDGGRLLESPHVAHTKIEYLEALTKEVGRYFVVLRLALPKATHSYVDWKESSIPPQTLMFLNSWACSRDPAVFSDPDSFTPERWLDDDQIANRHQYAFGIGGRMCVASHVASKALYTVLLHLVAHFRILPAEGSSNDEIDPVAGLAVPGNHQAAPRARHVRIIPRNQELTRGMLSVSA
ncbi:Cytochrome P450 2H2 [Colletotrichum higginsianum IMI 349063]|uniref:Cytochrome P450 2H2 n=2 Tax=Colletotrichum higginsianum (strain IMI 349063) TaxID=759273 RepID=A0A1B7XS00_COLHI|nr:Cytochrome P450 2H2 [Colletotrichum higginsianum IMI 349063]OBR02520.1 Cytochrome P450 2H2 [Colletotrichum higginsianum IMI 349063]